MLRDVNCGELRAKDAGRIVKIAGWVRKIRDHGEIIFVDLWDRYGITQIVFSSEKLPIQEVKRISLEWVILVQGEVRKRPKDMINKNIETGEIEVYASNFEVLNPSEVPPFVVQEEIQAEKELRFKYRYLDLRRKKAISNFILRHKLMQIAREVFNKKNFIEVETPILATPTPEGARDFLVPSRLQKGKFYSLAQSPQLYKQILMVAGFDRYYQISKCFRDEDMRGDRQLEFTQIDFEISFAEREDILKIVEELISAFFKESLKEELSTPFPRLTYREALNKYGTDKPDLRNPLLIVDYSKEAKSGEFGIFNKAKQIKGIKTKSLFTRSEISYFEKITKEAGAKGLLFLINEGGNYKGPFAKYFKNLEIFKLEKGETLFLLAGESEKEVLIPLGTLRIKLGEELSIIKKTWSPLWVTDFPMFEWDEQNKTWTPSHHIFTEPLNPEDLEKDPEKLIGNQYDLVLNGIELGSGSIRAHKIETQLKLLKVLGMSEEEAWKKFGFLLKALSLGAPPHGGFALGFDRICMLLAKEESITDVIAFPKTLSGLGLMESSPGKVTEEELKELNITIKEQ
ncbi:MAG: aspartate--tRNA ligase [candidate division WOR-3 bacterium]